MRRRAPDAAPVAAEDAADDTGASLLRAAQPLASIALDVPAPDNLARGAERGAPAPRRAHLAERHPTLGLVGGEGGAP